MSLKTCSLSPLTRSRSGYRRLPDNLLRLFREPSPSLDFLSYHPVKVLGILFFHTLGWDFENFHFQGSVGKVYDYLLSCSHLFARLCHRPIHQDDPVLAGLLGLGTPFYQTGIGEVGIQSHAKICLSAVDRGLVLSEVEGLWSVDALQPYLHVGVLAHPLHPS